MHRTLSLCGVLTVLVCVTWLSPLGSGAEDAVAAAPPGDVITLRDCAELPCTAGAIDAEGQVSFTAAFLDGPARTRLADMLRLRLQRTVAEKDGTHLVRLTNDDRFVGDVVELDEETLILKSALFGELKMPRQVVYSISRRKHNPVLLVSDFATGSMDGWKKVSGSWRLSKEGLRGSGNTVRGVTSVLREIKHEGAVTLVIQLDGSKQGKGGPKPKPFSVSARILGSVNVSVTPGRVNGGLYKPGGMHYGLARDVTGACDSFGDAKGEVRIAYDPEGQKRLHIWVNGKAITLMKDLEGVQLKGDHIYINTNSPVTLRSVQMYAGVVEPGADLAPGKDVEIVVMVNRDALRVKDVVVEDGKAVLQSADGEFKLDMANIGHIIMRSEGRRAMPLRDGDVRVRLEDSIATLKLAELAAAHLTGRSESVGDLRVLRGAVASLDMDPSGAKRAAAARSPWPSLPRMTLPNGTPLHVSVGSVKDGKATVTAPWLVGPAVAPIPALARLDMGRTAMVVLQDETVYLSDGSTLGCAMKALDPKTCTFKSPILGALSVPRSQVAAITTGNTGGLVLAHDFAGGKLPEGSVKHQRWKSDARGLVAWSPKKPCVLGIPMTHAGPMTVELVLKIDPNVTRLCSAVTAYAPDVVRDAGEQKGLKVVVTNSSISASSRSGYVPRLTAGREPFFRPEGGTVMLNFSPSAGTIQCRVDDRLIGELKKPYKPKGPAFLVLTVYGTGGGTIIESLRVWKGLALGGAGAFEAAKLEDVIVLVDGKRSPAGRVAIADGKVAGANGVGYAMTEMSTIALAAATRTDVARGPEHATVRMAGGNILMRVEALDAEFLTGTSPILGKLRIPRAAVQSIVIKELAAPKLQPKRRPGVNPWGG